MTDEGLPLTPEVIDAMSGKGDIDLEFHWYCTTCSKQGTGTIGVDMFGQMVAQHGKPSSGHAFRTNVKWNE